MAGPESETPAERLSGVDFLFKFDETAGEGEEDIAAEVVAGVEVVSDLVEVDADLAELMEGGLIVFVDDADVESGLAEILGESEAGGGGFGGELALLALGDAQVDAAATFHEPPSHGCCGDPATVAVPVSAGANRHRLP